MSFQSILNEITPAPTGSLYHYTTQPGLLGIIENREIWATHTQYLNDTNEFTCTSSLVLELLERMCMDPEYEGREHTLREMAESIRGHESINICVCSFSTLRDSLPQWRAYSSGSSGYAVGFDATFLRNLSAEHAFLLAKCIYDETTQNELIKDLVNLVLDEIDTWEPEHQHDEPLPGAT